MNLRITILIAVLLNLGACSTNDVTDGLARIPYNTLKALCGSTGTCNDSCEDGRNTGQSAVRRSRCDGAHL